MILTPHLIFGAAIASKISNPFLAIPAALISHYLLDTLPHKDYYSITNIHQKQWNKSFFDFSKVFLDIFLGGALILLFSDGNILLFLIALSAIVPDGMTLVSILISGNKLIMRQQKFHIAMNRIGDAELNKKIPVSLGIISQIAITLIAILLLR